MYVHTHVCRKEKEAGWTVVQAKEGNAGGILEGLWRHFRHHGYSHRAAAPSWLPKWHSSPETAYQSSVPQGATSSGECQGNRVLSHSMSDETKDSVHQAKGDEAKGFSLGEAKGATPPHPQPHAMKQGVGVSVQQGDTGNFESVPLHQHSGTSQSGDIASIGGDSIGIDKHSIGCTQPGGLCPQAAAPSQRPSGLSTNQGIELSTNEGWQGSDLSTNRGIELSTNQGSDLSTNDHQGNQGSQGSQVSQGSQSESQVLAHLPYFELFASRYLLGVICIEVFSHDRCLTNSLSPPFCVTTHGAERAAVLATHRSCEAAACYSGGLS